MMSGHHLRYGSKNFINIDFEIGYLDYTKLKLQLRIPDLCNLTYFLYFTFIVKTSSHTFWYGKIHFKTWFHIVPYLLSRGHHLIGLSL